LVPGISDGWSDFPELHQKDRQEKAPKSDERHSLVVEESSTASRFSPESGCRTVSPFGLTGDEVDRLSGAVRFMDARYHGGLWYLTVKATDRSMIRAIWKYIGCLQGDHGLPVYSVLIFEGHGGLHAHAVFPGSGGVKRKLLASKRFGGLIKVKWAWYPQGLVQYYTKERTVDAGDGRGHIVGTRLRGIHRLQGGGDRVRLSDALKRDAIAAGYVRRWRRTNARRSARP
jgi:hypothetical protein